MELPVNRIAGESLYNKVEMYIYHLLKKKFGMLYNSIVKGLLP